MNSEGEAMLRDANEALARFEHSPQPLIRCCFAYESGLVAGDQNDNIPMTLRDASRLTFVWNDVPPHKGRACIQLNDAARSLHYWIRTAQQGAVTVFEGIATIVFLPLYEHGIISAEVHRIRRAKSGILQLDNIREWLLEQYLLEFENYDESTFVDWIVASMHLPADAGADGLETWYRERAQHVAGQGRG